MGLGSKTNISWTDATWNPTRGCSRVSAGCTNCYAIRQAHRQNAPGRPFAGLTANRNGRIDWTGDVMLVSEALALPLRWKESKRIFVDSMSDLFHPKVSDEFILRVFNVMYYCQWHAFQVLTKRPERMQRFVRRLRLGPGFLDSCVGPGFPKDFRYVFKLVPDEELEENEGFGGFSAGVRWNIWLGTSVEDQDAADERIPHLFRTPAVVRFLSAEPLLGPIRFRSEWWDGIGNSIAKTLHWCIVGGESGPGFRAMDLDWARSLRDQCRAAGVAFWFKQSGGRFPGRGVLLDGVEHHEFPKTGMVIV